MHAVMRQALLPALLIVMWPALAEFDSEAFDTQAFDDQAFEFGIGPTVIVPSVIGLSLEDADTALEGDGLDTGSTSSTCSVEDEDVVVSQAPVAGSVVPEGSTVDLIASSGEPCTGAGGKLRLRLDLRL